MSKKLTAQQIEQQAQKLGIQVAALRAVIEVECKGSGFNADGTPVILYERHIFHRRLQAINWITKSKEWTKLHPDLCNPLSGNYGKYSEQHAKLNRAAKLNRDVALESCSWGIGQVMGFHWQLLEYDSIQAFVNAMYESEAKQLDAMCRYIEKNNLIQHLKNKDWAKFARGYNGVAYAKNQYDKKLAAAYKKWGGE